MDDDTPTAYSPPATPNADLIRRLRACEIEYVEGQPAGVGAPFNPDGPEAADALEALEAERDRQQYDFATQQISRNAELEAQVREALEFYAKWGNECRRIGRGGDDARANLDGDGGQRARAALARLDAAVARRERDD